MPSVKAPHHKGTYHQQSARVRAAANADPDTQCWKCGRTLAQARRFKPKAHWCAGHVIRGQEGGDLLAECSICSNAEGGRTRTRKSKRRSPRSWD